MITLDNATVVDDGITLLPPTSITLQAGEALAVRGRNGTGKTTLLRILAGLTRPTSGTATIAGTRPNLRDRGFRERVAAMIGHPPFAPDLTVTDHARLVAATWFRDAATAEDRADQALSELHLEHLARRFPYELSSGQTQLFALALVLTRPCEVLVLDEPEQRLDPEHIDAVASALRTRHDQGTTIVFATHSSQLAEAAADHTLTLKELP